MANTTSPPTYDSPNSARTINIRAQTEQMLHNAVVMTQMAMELKERTSAGEKYVCYLRTLAVRAGKVLTTMQNSGRSFLLLAQKLCMSAVKTIDAVPAPDQMIYNIKVEYERLLNILEKELTEIEDIESVETALNNDVGNVSLQTITDSIRYLEAKQKLAESNYLPLTNSTKSVKSEVDEKYPENWSRESLIDINSVVNLPPVPEDIFTSFNKPIRTSSMSSLKNLRKVKLYLQRAANTSDDDDESECDEQEGDSSLIQGDLQRTGTNKSGVLGNITEEAVQD